MTYTIFGESHGPAIGVVLEGVPSGVEMDLDFIRAELAASRSGESSPDYGPEGGGTSRRFFPAYLTAKLQARRCAPLSAIRTPAPKITPN